MCYEFGNVTETLLFTSIRQYPSVWLPSKPACSFMIVMCGVSGFLVRDVNRFFYFTVCLCLLYLSFYFCVLITKLLFSVLLVLYRVFDESETASLPSWVGLVWAESELVYGANVKLCTKDVLFFFSILFLYSISRKWPAVFLRLDKQYWHVWDWIWYNTRNG
jgi:hypothetical protein